MPNRRFADFTDRELTLMTSAFRALSHQEHLLMDVTQDTLKAFQSEIEDEHLTREGHQR